MTTHIVAWTKRIDDEHVDDYIALRNDPETARLTYERLLKEDDTHIASICVVLESTDYDGATAAELQHLAKEARK